MQRRDREILAAQRVATHLGIQNHIT